MKSMFLKSMFSAMIVSSVSFVIGCTQMAGTESDAVEEPTEVVNPARDSSKISMSPALAEIADASKSQSALDEALLEELKGLGTCSESITYPNDLVKVTESDLESTSASAASCCGGFPPCHVVMNGCGWCYLGPIKLNGTVEVDYDASCHATVTSTYCGWLC